MNKKPKIQQTCPGNLRKTNFLKVEKRNIHRKSGNARGHRQKRLKLPWIRKGLISLGTKERKRISTDQR